MQDESKKTVRKLLKAAGVAAGTCIIAAGAFFVTDTSLAFLNTKIEKTKLPESMSERISEMSESETEYIAKTDDFFVIIKKEENSDKTKESNKKGDSQSEQTGQNPDGYEDDGYSGDGQTGGYTGGGQEAVGGGYSEDDGTGFGSWGQGGTYETHPSGTNLPETNPPETNPPETNPPETNPPETNPPETNPPETNPPETNPPQIEAPPAAWDDTYVFADTASRYIEEHELDNMTAEEIVIARNEIFARHGRIFTTPKWRDYFAAKTWYVPVYDQETFDSMDLLNDFEKKNLKVILEYEEKK